MVARADDDNFWGLGGLLSCCMASKGENSRREHSNLPPRPKQGVACNIRGAAASTGAATSPLSSDASGTNHDDPDTVQQLFSGAPTFGAVTTQHPSHGGGQSDATAGDDACIIKKTGIFKKRGQFNTDFRTRFFALEGTNVQYFASEADYEAKHPPKGAFSCLGLGTNKDGGHTKDGYLFTLFLANKKVIECSCNSAADRTAWLEALESAAQSAVRLRRRSSTSTKSSHDSTRASSPRRTPWNQSNEYKRQSSAPWMHVPKPIYFVEEVETDYSAHGTGIPHKQAIAKAREEMFKDPQSRVSTSPGRRGMRSSTSPERQNESRSSTSPERQNGINNWI